MKLKFLSECSTEALLEIFDPKLKAQVGSGISGYIIRQVVLELLDRKQELTPTMLQEMRGPSDARCKHGRSIMGFCGVCDTDIGQLHHVAVVELLKIENIDAIFIKTIFATKDSPEKNIIYVIAKENGIVPRLELLRIEDLLSKEYGLTNICVRAHQGRPINDLAEVKDMERLF